MVADGLLDVVPGAGPDDEPGAELDVVPVMAVVATEPVDTGAESNVVRMKIVDGAAGFDQMTEVIVDTTCRALKRGILASRKNTGQSGWRTRKVVEQQLEGV